MFELEQVCNENMSHYSEYEKAFETDLQYMYTNKTLLRVREENERAIRCYKSVGFKENRRFRKNDLNVIEMIYEA